MIEWSLGGHSVVEDGVGCESGLDIVGIGKMKIGDGIF